MQITTQAYRCLARYEFMHSVDYIEQGEGETVILLHSTAAGSVLTALSEGQPTPIEATRVMGLIDSYR